MTVSGHRLLTDADLAGSRPVSEAELQAAIANVCAMSSADFFDACDAIDLPVQAHVDVLARWNRREAIS